MYESHYPPGFDINDCSKEDQVSTQVVGWLLTVGAAASFIPQIYALLVNKNLDGLSALTWALNYLSNMATMVNATILNWKEIQCCEYVPALQCIENLVPLANLSGPAICTFIIFTLTTLYSDRLTPQEKLTQEELRVNSKRSATDFFAFIFGSYSFIRPLFLASVALTIILVSTGALLMIFVGITAKGTILYADVIGIIAVVFLMVMYVPQLYTTFKAKHQGSLSLATLLLQCPGSLAIVYFDLFQAKPPLSWTTWAPYLVSAIQQFVLIIMCIYYYFRNRGQAHKTPGETDPLLAHGTVEAPIDAKSHIN